jgi:hypothetical protein
MTELLKKIIEVSTNFLSDFMNTLSELIQKVTPDAFANGFSTLVGAFFGAVLAYFLQRKFQKTTETETAEVAGHKLMFSLLQQINTLVLIQRDYIFEHLQNPFRFLSIPAMSQHDLKKNILELPDLSFLLNSKDGRAVLYNFYIAQENYIEAMSQLNLRSTLHLEKIQPALAASGIQQGAEISEEELRLKLNLDSHVYGAIINSTNNCIISIQRAYEKLSAVKIEARVYLVRRFKTEDFTEFSIEESYGLTESNESLK